MFAIEECIRTAQRGGVGVVVYFRKEGRALGEVTKYLVYNLRKRGGDSADKYFRATELIAGVKDMRFQVLMPDVLHWLGIKKVDNMVSMSDMCGSSYIWSLICVDVRSEQEIRVHCRVRHTHPSPLRHPWFVSCHWHSLRSTLLMPGYFQNTLFLWTRESKSTRKSLRVTSQVERLLLPKTSSRRLGGRGRRRSINDLFILYSISVVE